MKENPYWKERSVIIPMLNEELDLLFKDYQIVNDVICKVKIKTLFDQKESQLYEILKEDLDGNRENIRETSREYS